MLKKAISLYVYKHDAFHTCANGGITERHDTVLILHPQGTIEVDMDNPPENLVKVVSRTLHDGEYKHLEPYAPVPQGRIGYMSGGSFAHTSDARFTRISKYPLRIHDRTE